MDSHFILLILFVLNNCLIMATKKQIEASKKNIKKAQEKWKSMTHRQHALVQPQGRARKKLGSIGEGNFFRITVRPKGEFVSYKNHDIGKKGHIERVAGRRSSGSWATHAWLIAKGDAKVVNGVLVGKTKVAKEVISKLSSKPKIVKGDIFEAKPKKNVPEKNKPTTLMKKAQRENIKKAQNARWRKE